MSQYCRNKVFAALLLLLTQELTVQGSAIRAAGRAIVYAFSNRMLLFRPMHLRPHTHLAYEFEFVISISPSLVVRLSPSLVNV